MPEQEWVRRRRFFIATRSRENVAGSGGVHDRESFKRRYARGRTATRSSTCFWKVEKGGPLLYKSNQHRRPKGRKIVHLVEIRKEEWGKLKFSRKKGTLFGKQTEREWGKESNRTIRLLRSQLKETGKRRGAGPRFAELRQEW